MSEYDTFRVDIHPGVGTTSYCTGEKQVFDAWPAVPVEWNGGDIGWVPIGESEPVKLVILDPHDARIFHFYTYEGVGFLPTGWHDSGPDHERGDECWR